MKVPKVKKCSVAGKNSASRVCQRCLKSTSALQILEQGLVGEGRDMGGGVYTRGTPISGSRVAVCQLRPNHSQFQPPSKCPLSSTIQTEERQGEKSNTGSKQWEPRQGSSVPPAKPVYVCVCVCVHIDVVTVRTCPQHFIKQLPTGVDVIEEASPVLEQFSFCY